mmetsp:Transcript_47287/g.90256  ORF Transcript_47287/g.90256 Transcript_47287/m.90256 type:complete len:320 (-) Transcript_47287:1056-2015(-)
MCRTMKSKTNPRQTYPWAKRRNLATKKMNQICDSNCKELLIVVTQTILAWDESFLVGFATTAQHRTCAHTSPASCAGLCATVTPCVSRRPLCNAATRSCPWWLRLTSACSCTASPAAGGRRRSSSRLTLSGQAACKPSSTASPPRASTRADVSGCRRGKPRARRLRRATPGSTLPSWSPLPPEQCSSAGTLTPTSTLLWRRGWRAAPPWTWPRRWWGRRRHTALLSCDRQDITRSAPEPWASVCTTTRAWRRARRSERAARGACSSWTGTCITATAPKTSSTTTPPCCTSPSTATSLGASTRARASLRKSGLGRAGGST